MYAVRHAEAIWEPLPRFPQRELYANVPVQAAEGLPMKVVGRNRLQSFCDKHADARKWLENWLSEAEASSWATSNDIKMRYASASFLANNTVIFNVKGNDYRMEVTVAYNTGVVSIRWIGSHAAYDKRNSRR
jgi:mRNA interferase HigB